jgi:sn-glycerol 3-phosphate transport system substrate-binding protein
VTLSLVDKFNQSHPEIKVDPVHKGSYAENLTAAIAAYKSGNAPHVVQVYEVGTQTLLDSGAIVPVYELFSQHNIGIDWQDFLGPLRAYYSVDDNLYSLPFNSSTPFLYTNKDAYESAGLDPDTPPETFADLESMGQKLVDSGAVEVAWTAGWPSWTLVENMFTWHVKPIANNKNGYSDHASKLMINSDFGVKLFQTYRRWQDRSIFAYEGREGTPNPSYLTGKTAMIITSTAYLGGFKEAAEFEIGSGFLPHMEGEPQGNSLIGGATLWVFKGHPEADYAAVGEFLNFIATTEQQVYWHKNTGYLPVTNSAVKALEQEGWFKENPNHATAFRQLQIMPASGEFAGLRLGDFVAIREIILSEIESLFSGAKGVEEALDDAVEKSNQRLKRYIETH